ncbi:hypothetical protein Droror1_Dr00014313 [Drosera rotundifolia]
MCPAQAQFLFPSPHLLLPSPAVSTPSAPPSHTKPSASTSRAPQPTAACCHLVSGESVSRRAHPAHGEPKTLPRATAQAASTTSRHRRLRHRRVQIRPFLGLNDVPRPPTSPEMTSRVPIDPHHFGPPRTSTPRPRSGHQRFPHTTTSLVGLSVAGVSQQQPCDDHRPDRPDSTTRHGNDLALVRRFTRFTSKGIHTGEVSIRVPKSFKLNA